MVAHCCEKDDDFLLVVAGSGAELPVFTHDDWRRFWDIGVCGEELISEDKGGLGHVMIYGLDDGKVNQYLLNCDGESIQICVNPSPTLPNSRLREERLGEGNRTYVYCG